MAIATAVERLQLQISLIISHIKLILKALSEICHKLKKCRLYLINSILKVGFIWLRNGYASPRRVGSSPTRPHCGSVARLADAAAGRLALLSRRVKRSIDGHRARYCVYANYGLDMPMGGGQQLLVRN